jgi:3-methylcrotonyl-CoA carboxylase alpha subunit
VAEHLRFDGLELEAVVLPGAQGAQQVRLGAEPHTVVDVRREGNRLSFIYEGQRYSFDVLVSPGRAIVATDLANHSAERVEPGAEGEARGAGELVSKMPGKVLQLLVTPGTQVAAGTPLLILEAMKMEHQFAAPADGTLHGYPVTEGQRVMPGDLLADFTPASL